MWSYFRGREEEEVRAKERRMLVREEDEEVLGAGFWGLARDVELRTGTVDSPLLIFRGCITFSQKSSKVDCNWLEVMVWMYFNLSSYLLQQMMSCD